MTWTFVTKYTRPNTGVDWFVAEAGNYMTTSDRSYVITNYVDNSKRVSAVSSVSCNGLELTKTFVFRDEAAKNEYVNDSRIQSFRSAQTSYNSANNITRTGVSNGET